MAVVVFIEGEALYQGRGGEVVWEGIFSKFTTNKKKKKRSDN